MNDYYTHDLAADTQYEYFDRLLSSTPKGWIEDEIFGKVLFKETKEQGDFAREKRTDWSEKIGSEISQKIGLPSAKYELAQIERNGETVTGSISQDLRQSEDYQRHSLKKVMGILLEDDDSYTVENVLKALDKGKVKLPPNYEVPEGIKNAGDMFLGILAQDTLTGNVDRHAQNIEIVETNGCELYLSPNFDNGLTLGAGRYDTQRRSDISNPDYHSSMFRDETGARISNIEAFERAAKLRPEASKIWLKRINTLESQQLNELVDRVPDERITPIAKTHAKDLLEHNHQKLRELEVEMFTDKPKLAKIYNNFADRSEQFGEAKIVEIAQHSLEQNMSKRDIQTMLLDNNTIYASMIRGMGPEAGEALFARAQANYDKSLTPPTPKLDSASVPLSAAPKPDKPSMVRASSLLGKHLNRVTTAPKAPSPSLSGSLWRSQMLGRVSSPTSSSPIKTEPEVKTEAKSAPPRSAFAMYLSEASKPVETATGKDIER